MSARAPAAPPRPLKPTERGGVLAWLRRKLGRPTPQAVVVAAPEVRLGEELAVTWRLDWSAGVVTNVSVMLVGREVARQRISARTGISVVTDARPFLTLAVDRRMPDASARTADGRGAVVVPASSVPSVGGVLNEIAWVIVVEAASQAEVIWTGTFSLTVLPSVPA
jgi:hypothetical protein